MKQDQINEILKKHKLYIQGEEGGEKANLSNADLRYANLSNADLRYADLYNANLYNANLSNANLSNADLRYADLYNANLYNANLYNANLSNANLSNANLRYADLYNCCYMAAGAGGKHRRPIMCNPEEKLVQAGCFKGSLEEFKKAVIKKYGDDYGSYKAVIAYLDAVMADLQGEEVTDRT